MRAPRLTAILCLLWFSTALADERVIFTRSDVIAATAGEASLRRAYTRQIELPSVQCEGGEPLTCRVDRTYGQVYLLTMLEETTSHGEVQRRDRGRLSIAVGLDKKEETAFEDALVEHLEELGVPEFARPQAGMMYNEKPLVNDVLLKSELAAWICAELDGAYHYDVVAANQRCKGPDGKPAPCDRMFSNEGAAAKAACEAIERAVRDVGSTVFRTTPDLREQIRHEIRLAEASTLQGLTWANRLVKLPEGAKLTKGKLENGMRTGASTGETDGVFHGHEGRYGGVELDVRLPPASIDLEGVPMWITRFTFASTRERFGKDPVSEREPDRSLLVAVAPIADPLMNELARAKTDLTVPKDRMLEAAVARFERSAALGPDLLSDTLTDPEVWPARGSWMVVTCRDDGTARWGIAPFAEAAPVENAREACAAIRREIGE